MQTVNPGTTVRWGNHALTAEEAAAGVPERLPFVDIANAPVDPDVVTATLKAPTGVRYTFAYPQAGPTDSGTLEQEATGRFFVDWTPADEEDGLWECTLKGGNSLGTSQGDQDVFFRKRLIGV